MWAFGVLCYEVFTDAVTPYDGLNNHMVLVKVKGGYRLPCPNGCPEDVYQKYMLACWAASPQDRPTFADLARDLDKVAGTRRALLTVNERRYSNSASSGTRTGEHSARLSPRAAARRVSAASRGARSGASRAIGEGDGEAVGEEAGEYLDLAGDDGKVIRAEDEIDGGRRHFDWRHVVQRLFKSGMVHAQKRGAPPEVPGPRMIDVVEMAHRAQRCAALQVPAAWGETALGSTLADVPTDEDNPGRRGSSIEFGQLSVV